MLANIRQLICAATVLSCTAAGRVHGQPASAASSHVVIASLANDTNPSDLDFQGGECELDSTGRMMTCEFQQVFMTISPLDTQTCLATTNRYALTFEKTGEHAWVSRQGPTGPCGALDVTTLTDEGNLRRWTLEQRRTMTRKDAAACGGPDPKPEVHSWRNVRRPLPCRFLQPGALR